MTVEDSQQDSQSFGNQYLDDRLLGNYGLGQISMEDWAATPESVKRLVSLGNYSLARFLDATSIGISVHDAMGNLVYTNQAGRALLLVDSSGSPKKAEELPQAFHIYRSTTGRLYPLGELPSSLALAGKKVQADDLELHHLDRIIPLEVVANPVFDDSGQVIHVIATFQDITERRQAEQALVESKISYRQVVEAQTDFVLRSTPDTTIFFGNSAICRALGCSLEELCGNKWTNFANPEDLQDILRKIGELTIDNPSFLNENRDLRGDGSIGWTHWLNQGIFNLQGELVEIQSVGRDITVLKQTMTALQESEARFRNITENIPGAVFRYLLRADSSDAVIYMSSGCYELWEVEAQVVETDAKVLWEMVHPEDVGKMFDSVLRSAHNLEPWFFEWRITSPSGKQKWLQATGRPERTPEGNTVWDTLVLEVSDRKQAELELQAQQELLQLIFEHMPVMASIFSPTGEILMINRHLEQVVGWTWDDYQSMDVLRECYPEPRDYERAKAHISRADSTWIEIKTRVRDGRVLDLHWIQVRLTDGRSMAIGQDITEQKCLINSLAEINQELELRVAQRTEALEKQDALLQESRRVARLGSWEMKIPTEEIYWSPEMFQIFGYDLSKFAPNFSQQRRNFVSEDWERLMELVDRAIGFGEPYELDLQIIREDGSRGYIFAKGQPVIDETGRVQRLVGVAMDISDRKLVEAKNQKITQKLAAANRELEAFAYSVSHDLRSPLRAIDGFSKALIEDYGDQFDEEAKDYFDRIHRAVERMGNLIDDLLRLSRVSRAEIQHSPVNLTEIAQEIATELQTSEPDRRVEFLIAPGLMVYADSNLLRVVLENLFRNAWKFTSHHPTARIEIGSIETSRTESSKQINQEANQQTNQVANQGTNQKTNQEGGEEIVYFVRDDGAGFDMSYASMLFGVFQRLHNTNEFPGTGIGLATVQRVIHRHGGRVWAEGVVEAGATIYFTVPPNSD